MIKVDEADPIGELDPTFPYRDVEIKRGVDMKEFYELDGEIGRGKFGTVYKCREKGTNLTLAAKFVGIARRQDRKNVEREVEIMRTLQHPRLIQLYDAFETDNVMCVVLELIEGGELFERVIDDDFILTERACTVFMRQICEGVAFIHSNNIIHLDLKPENILCLTKTGNRIKIIDFGLARKFEPDKKLQVLFGTPEFVAPEVVNFDQISCATDMWSVGVICYVLLSGLSPFMGETDVETMANVTVARYDFDDDSFEEISPDAKDFISKLLLKDKEARLTAVECLSHPWLRRQIPPPPPALDTTKDNLRNYVEKYVPFSPSPVIVENHFIHNKPGLIEKIIENEQKDINYQCIQKINKDLPVIPPISENIQGHNFLNAEHSLFDSLNQPCNNEKDSLPFQVFDNKPSVMSETIQENNIKNSVPTNNQLPSFFFENVCPKKEAPNLIQQNITNAVDGKPLPGFGSNENINKNMDPSIVGSLKTSLNLINEKAIDNDGIVPKVSNAPLNFNSNNNSLNIQNMPIKNDTVNVNPIKPIDFKVNDKSTPMNNDTANVNPLKPLDFNVKDKSTSINNDSVNINPLNNLDSKVKDISTSMNNDTVNVNTLKNLDLKVKDISMSMEASSDTFQYNQRLDKKLVEKLSTIEEQQSQIRSFNRNQIQMKIQEENTALCVNKLNANPTVIIPSKSSQTASNVSSDFSIAALKKDDSFTRKNDNMFIPEFMKNTSMKKTVNEHNASSVAYNEHFSKEPIKDNDPHIFKQHLRSTPPWFSELSNNNARKNSGDRFDRRSSDFSCFLNSKEDSESLNLADEIRKLSARLLQMSSNQTLNQNQPLGAYNTNSIPPRTRNDPISCFLENHGIPHPRPKFKFSNLNRDVPIGSPPPPSNLAYYLNVAKNCEKKDSRSAPESPRSSPERTHDPSITNKPNENDKSELFYMKENSNIMSQEKISSKTILEQVHINKTNKKLNFPV